MSFYLQGVRAGAARHGHGRALVRGQHFGRLRAARGGEVPQLTVHFAQSRPAQWHRAVSPCPSWSGGSATVCCDALRRLFGFCS